ncbi:histidine kinase 1 [Actinidia rufa]|uniref:Histidine kinase 1 n=1 Tax=Actinidia rufa TaxID=165716 RepID=A0A7J0F0T9_9ERIC|nr:histidine kinase 1 [Actinidia rufa]
MGIRHGGTDLGLCIVRTLVNKMGGEIKVVKKNGPELRANIHSVHLVNKPMVEHSIWGGGLLCKLRSIPSISLAVWCSPFELSIYCSTRFDSVSTALHTDYQMTSWHSEVKEGCTSMDLSLEQNPASVPVQALDDASSIEVLSPEVVNLQKKEKIQESSSEKNLEKLEGISGRR